MMLRLLFICLLATTLRAAERPNVLFIAVDDLRASVGVFGDKLAVTPNIDALGTRGTVFANAHCQIAICNPSRASVMTGMRPDTIRVWGLKKHFREEKLAHENFAKNVFAKNCPRKLRRGGAAGSS